MGFLVVKPYEMKNDYRELSLMRCRLNSKDAFLLGPIRFVNHKFQLNCECFRSYSCGLNCGLVCLKAIGNIKFDFKKLVKYCDDFFGNNDQGKILGKPVSWNTKAPRNWRAF